MKSELNDSTWILYKLKDFIYQEYNYDPIETVTFSELCEYRVLSKGNIRKYLDYNSSKLLYSGHNDYDKYAQYVELECLENNIDWLFSSDYYPFAQYDNKRNRGNTANLKKGDIIVLKEEDLEYLNFRIDDMENISNILKKHLGDDITEEKINDITEEIYKELISDIL